MYNNVIWLELIYHDNIYDFRICSEATSVVYNNTRDWISKNIENIENKENKLYLILRHLEDFIVYKKLCSKTNQELICEMHKKFHENWPEKMLLIKNSID